MAGNPVPLYAMQIAQCNISITSIASTSDSTLRPFTLSPAAANGHLQIERQPLADNAPLLQSHGLNPAMSEAPAEETMHLIRSADNHDFGTRLAYDKGDQLEMHTRVVSASVVPGTAAIYQIMCIENGAVVGGVGQEIVHN